MECIALIEVALISTPNSEPAGIEIAGLNARLEDVGALLAGLVSVTVWVSLVRVSDSQFVGVHTKMLKLAALFTLPALRAATLRCNSAISTGARHGPAMGSTLLGEKSLLSTLGASESYQ